MDELLNAAWAQVESVQANAKTRTLGRDDVEAAVDLLRRVTEYAARNLEAPYRIVVEADAGAVSNSYKYAADATYLGLGGDFGGDVQVHARRGYARRCAGGDYGRRVATIVKLDATSGAPVALGPAASYPALGMDGYELSPTKYAGALRFTARASSL